MARIDLKNIRIPKFLQDIRDRVADPRAGLFGPDSMFWRVGRENILLMGGPAAALLQMAHPLVAAGVSDHSDFDRDPIGRFKRTFGIVYRIVFADADEAILAAAAAYHIHKAVRGKLPEHIGGHPAGSPYYANRSDLLLWVHATLIQQSLLAYQLFVEPLTPAEQEQYYEETKLFGKVFGIADKDLPQDLTAFYAYFDYMVENVLGVGSQGMHIRKKLIGGLPQYALLTPLSYLAAGAMLPTKTRQQFELPWNPAMKLAWETVVATGKRVLPHVPPLLRYQKHYLRAMKRLELPTRTKLAA